MSILTPRAALDFLGEIALKQAEDSVTKYQIQMLHAIVSEALYRPLGHPEDDVWPPSTVDESTHVWRRR